MAGRFTRLKLIRADGGYTGELLEWARRSLGRVIEIVKRSKLSKFVVLAFEDVTDAAERLRALARAAMVNHRPSLFA